MQFLDFTQSDVLIFASLDVFYSTIMWLLLDYSLCRFMVDIAVLVHLYEYDASKQVVWVHYIDKNYRVQISFWTRESNKGVKIVP